MKLKTIPNNTVVHTPTEAEAKELLAILHENGYKWYHKYAPIPNPNLSEVKYINIYNYLNGCSKVITYCDEKTLVGRFLTLAEFKERYCDFVATLTDECKSRVKVEEKPQPKFKVGDKVYKTTGHDRLDEYTVEKVYVDKRGGYVYDLKGLIGILGVEEKDLCWSYQNPYASPESKGTESGAKGNDSENSLDLCELLKGHIGETFFATSFGDVVFDGFNTDCDLHPFRISHKVAGIWNLAHDGRMHESTPIILFPSRALYEQYPLDAAKAWSEWRKEQKKPFVCIHWGEIDCNGDEEEDYTGNIYFRTLSDRDKCIEEIKSVIEKYRK